MNCLSILAILLGGWCIPTQAAEWRSVPGHIKTQFGETVSPENVWREYPRPQMVRTEWQSLNGLWDYAIVGRDEPWTNGYVENALFDPLAKSLPNPPTSWDGKILVPFCPESALSGVGRLVRPNQLLWYRRTFVVPPSWSGQRLLLHFEAVDWHLVVRLNGVEVGDHKGGNVPFACDLTHALHPSGRQEITVVVWDPTNAGDQAVGKQALPEQKKGYRYTPTTGIWQSVWLEPVADTSLVQLRLVPDVDGERLIVEAQLRGDPGHCRVEASVFDGEKQIAQASGDPGQRLSLPLPHPKLWRPDLPFLYDLKVVLTRDGRKLDEVASYCGMRKIDVRADVRGIPRIHLNNQPIFQFGPLDQGYWPESLLTPPSDAAAKFDLQYLRDIGCNMVRVHIKVHPARWYYWCDKLGLLVWQDFPCTRKFDPHITKDSASQWEQEQGHLLDHLYNHPAIVMWVVFNEAWGQYDTERLATWTTRRDPSRLVNNASGWTDAGAGHLYDVHDYTFHTSIPTPGQITNRAVVLGECGGFNLMVTGHTWEHYPVKKRIDPLSDDGREDYPDTESWTPRYESWVDELRQLQSQGLNAAIYTQLTDIEHECNGWLTYDRAVSKIPAAKLRQIHKRLYKPLSPPKVILPLLSGGDTATRFTVGAAPVEWTGIDFDDSCWPLANGGVGNLAPAQGLATNANSGARLRRSFELNEIPRRLAVRVLGSGRTRLFLNGELVKTLHTSDLADYVPTSVAFLSSDAIKKLRPGRNVLALEFLPKSGSAPATVATGSELKHLDVSLFVPE